MIDLSVVVCTYNRAAMLDTLLESFHQNLEDTAPVFELLVIDNHSDDDTRHVALQWEKRPEMHLRYVFEPQQGSAYARNRALSIARGKWIWFVDDDIQFDNGWLAGVEKAICQFPDVMVIAGRIQLDFAEPPPSWLPDMALNYYGLTRFGQTSRLLQENEYPISANAGFRREVFNAVGNFRTDLGRKYRSLISWDETELSIRVREWGGQIAYAHDAMVYHRVPVERMSRGWLYRRVFADGISECRARYLARNPGAFFILKIALDKITLVLKRILRLQFSISDRLWMVRRLGIAWQCLQKVIR